MFDIYINASQCLPIVEFREPQLLRESRHKARALDNLNVHPRLK